MTNNGKNKVKEHKKLSSRIMLIIVLGVFVLLIAASIISTAAMALIAQYWPVEEDNLFVFSLVALAISIVVGFALSFAYSALMIKATRPYVQALQKIADFDFSVRIKDVPVLAEFGLAEKFNLMAKQLESVEMLREDFISDFSHEFKTPIVSISGFATLLKNPNLTAEEREEYLNVIIDESARLVQLSNSVLTLARLDSQTIVNEQFLLDEQLRQSMLLFEHLCAEKHIEMTADMEEICVVNEKKLLSQIWVNLLSNAVKFTSEGGKIEVFAQDVDGVVTVCIRDNGCGMSEETQKNMFNKFFQGDKSRATEGNGLGLSVVKKICELLQIRLDVQSALGVGTLFTLTFADTPAVQNYTTVGK